MGKLLKAAATLIAAVALISPVSAQAQLSDWTDEGLPVAAEAEVPLVGGFSYSGGISCPELSATLVLDPGSTGGVTSYSVTPGNCVITGTWKSLGCTALTGLTSESLPWTVHNTTNQITVTGAKTTFHFSGGAFCPKKVVLSGDGMTLTPDNPSAISSLAMGGTLSSSLGTNVTVGGTLEPANEADKGTFGL